MPYEYANHLTKRGARGLGYPSTDNILRLLEDNELRVRIAERGRESIKSFSWERSTDRLEKLLTAN